MQHLASRCAPLWALLALASSPALVGADEVLKPALARVDAKGDLLWYDARHLDVEGKGWPDTKSFYDRLPARAEKLVRAAVWDLSRHSAGLCVRFTTDATALHARWALTSNRLAMPHMPATGVSGLDLYVETGPGKWRWLAVGQPSPSPVITARLVDGLPPGTRNFLLYLPLYNGVRSLEIGVDKRSRLIRPAPRSGEAGKPLVFYGTSITQGGCASRPGMVHTALLGRRLGRSVINLGFSGNGRMESELAKLLAELDPAVYVLDCLPNMTAQGVAERVEPFVRTLRKARPHTPILLVEDRFYANASLLPALRQHNEHNHAALRKAYERLVKDGCKGLHYLSGEQLLGEDGEATVDGSHPTDLGFARQADAFEAVLRSLFKKGPSPQVRPKQEKPFVQVADTVSAEARQYLKSLPDPATSPAWPAPNDITGWKRMRRAEEAASEPKVQATLKRFQPTVKERKVGGVPVLDIQPKGWKDNGKVLVHAHGGAYTLYSAHSRLPSSVPAAAATGLRVVSVDYTLAPLGKWQQVTEQVVAVLGGLRKEGYQRKDIALYGESAGGALAAGSVLKMRDQGRGMPAAVVLWSPWADITDRGDSAITLKHFEPTYLYDKHLKPSADAYADPKDQKHPYVSPVYGDYSKGFPPTLIQGGTKELFLSHFVRQYRAIDGANGLAVLDLYEGMPHVFQIRPELVDAPETRAALKKMAAFLKRHLGD